MAWLQRLRLDSVFTLAGAKPEPENGEGEERADGIEEGIIRGGFAAGDEGLMDFVESGIAGGDKERGESPGPAPARAGTSNAAKEEKAKDEVFNEVGRFANVVVDQPKLRVGQTGYEPAENGLQDRGGVLRGEGVGGHDEDDDSPQESRPPDSHPRGDQQLFEARLHFRKLGSGTRIAPGLVRHAGLVRSENLH